MVAGLLLHYRGLDHLVDRDNIPKRPDFGTDSRYALFAWNSAVTDPQRAYIMRTLVGSIAQPQRMGLDDPIDILEGFHNRIMQPPFQEFFRVIDVSGDAPLSTITRRMFYFHTDPYGEQKARWEAYAAHLRECGVEELADPELPLAERIEDDSDYQLVGEHDSGDIVGIVRSIEGTGHAVLLARSASGSTRIYVKNSLYRLLATLTPQGNPLFRWLIFTIY